MSGGYSGRFSLKFLCALVCAFFAFSIAVNCFESHDVRADSPSVDYDGYDNWGDGVNFQVDLNDFEEGDEVTVIVSFPHKVEGNYNIWSPWGADYYLTNDQYDLAISFTYSSGMYIQGQACGTDIGNDTAKAYISSYDAPYVPPEPDTPTPEPTATPVPPTNTPVPTKAPDPTKAPTTAPTQTQQETQATQATAEADTTTDTSADTSDETTAVTESAAQTTTATVATSASVASPLLFEIIFIQGHSVLRKTS